MNAIRTVKMSYLKAVKTIGVPKSILEGYVKNSEKPQWNCLIRKPTENHRFFGVNFTDGPQTSHYKKEKKTRLSTELTDQVTKRNGRKIKKDETDNDSSEDDQQPLFNDDWDIDIDNDTKDSEYIFCNGFVPNDIHREDKEYQMF
ncbi:hypothetical protein FQR65_LT08804 [Abscondita terminalis]|nr:hypothetical protein FQR65_LT08804 [Abscondita terminalis]